MGDGPWLPWERLCQPVPVECGGVPIGMATVDVEDPYGRDCVAYLAGMVAECAHVTRHEAAVELCESLRRMCEDATDDGQGR